MDIIKNRLRHYGEAKIDTDTVEEGLVVIVPDTNPDALQIISSDATVYIQEKSCVQGMFKLTGSAAFCVNYLSTDGKEPYTVKASIPFSFSKEINGMVDEDRLISSVKLVSTSASLVNPRKLSLKAQLQILEKLYKCQTVEYAENIIPSGDDHTYFLRENVKTETISDIVEKRIVLSDEIRLGGEKLDGGSAILKRRSEWVGEDIKVLPNKIMIRGRVDTKVSALGSDGAYIGVSKYSVPFSQIIECDGVQPEDRVDVTFCPAREEIEVFTSSEDITTMTFAFAAVTECVIRRDVEIEVIKDVYSTKWEMTDKKSVLTTALTEPTLVTVPVKETISLDAQPEKVIDIDIRGASMAVKRGESAVGGNFFIALMCQMEDGTIATFGKKTYIDGVCPNAFERDGWCAAGTQNAECQLTGEGEAVVSFDALFTCQEGSGSPCELIAQCELDKNKAKEPKIKASLVIKSADRSDSVWNIAKAYNTSPAVIASANKIGADEVIQAGRLILIPSVER